MNYTEKLPMGPGVLQLMEQQLITQPTSHGSNLRKTDGKANAEIQFYTPSSTKKTEGGTVLGCTLAVLDFGGGCPISSVFGKNLPVLST